MSSVVVLCCSSRFGGSNHIELMRACGLIHVLAWCFVPKAGSVGSKHTELMRDCGSNHTELMQAYAMRH